MPDLTVPEVLDSAADLIDQYGWWNGDGRRAGRLCAGMAISKAGWPSEQGDGPAWRHFSASVGNVSVVFWNDIPGRTVDQVTAALRSAAEVARG